MPPAQTQLQVLQEIALQAARQTDLMRRITEALESIERKTINPDGTSGVSNA